RPTDSQVRTMGQVLREHGSLLIEAENAAGRTIRTDTVRNMRERRQFIDAAWPRRGAMETATDAARRLLTEETGSVRIPGGGTADEAAEPQNILRTDIVNSDELPDMAALDADMARAREQLQF